MFALFFNLYYAMFTGSWTNRTLNQVLFNVQSPINNIGKLITSLFNDVNTPYETFGTDIANASLDLISFVLALITSIGIVVVATKGIKKLFSVFFYGVR